MLQKIQNSLSATIQLTSAGRADAGSNISSRVSRRPEPAASLIKIDPESISIHTHHNSAPLSIYLRIIWNLNKDDHEHYHDNK